MSKGLLVSGVLLLTVCAGADLRAGQASPGQPSPVPSELADAAAQPPTFRAAVEYVEVDVVVTDGTGVPVRGLTRDDFQVFEDGRRQTISNFGVVSIPTEPADGPVLQPDVVPPDTASNERPFGGRLYVAVLDDVNVAFLRSQHVRNTARLFIERNLGANDLMAIVSTSGRRDWSQEFTSNKRLLLDAVDRFAGQKSRSAVVGLSDAYLRQRGNAEASRGLLEIDPDLVRDPEQEGGVVGQIGAAKTLMNVIDWFGRIRGRRKTMLLFSEGLPYDIKQQIGQDALRSMGANATFDGMQGAIAAATRANVSIYAIDPRGLTTMGDDDVTVSSFANTSFGGIDLGQRGLNDERRSQLQSLRIIADETGGFAVVNTNEFASAFDRIVNDNSAYYLLAYYPPSARRDGKFHKIEVKTTRRGLTIRSRKGYQAPRGNAPGAKPATEAGRPSPELQEALASPIPVGGLPMRMFAAPFNGTAPNASVLFGVELAGRALALAQDGAVEFGYVAVDAQGKTRAASTDTFTTRLTPETRARAQQSGFLMLHRIALPPGRYAIRLAARDVVAGTVGSLAYDLEVPDFAKPALSLSGVLLTSMTGSAMVTAKGDDQARAVLPASPIATRTFPQNDEIALFAEIYHNQAVATRRVDISTTIQTDDGHVLFSAEDEHDSSEVKGGTGGYRYALRIPLNDIPPGAYVLRLQAKSRLGNDEAVGRQLRVVVTPRVSPALSSSVAASPGNAAAAVNPSGVADGADTAAPDADYTRIVAAYRRGDVVAAVVEVAGWPEARIRSARNGTRNTSDAIARTLAMVHLEAAFALRPDARADRHLAVAEAFIDALPNRDADGFIARWQVLAARYDVVRSHRSEAVVRMRRARDKGVHSRHAELMLVAVEGSGPALGPAYRRVVEAYPDFLAARLRLGWALHINRSPDARRHLEMVAAEATRPDLRYLAFLFLGAVAERDKRLGDALRAYEAAVAAVPHQSALIGLMTVARALGESTRVQEATRKLQALGPAAGDDPWNLYNLGVTGDELLGELRAAARQP